jgi:hypothetical protein
MSPVFIQLPVDFLIIQFAFTGRSANLPVKVENHLSKLDNDQVNFYFPNRCRIASVSGGRIS